MKPDPLYPSQQQPVSTLWMLVVLVLLLGGMPRPTAAQGPYLNGFDLAGALVPVAEILRGGPPRDGIPAIDRPRFLSADEADQMLGPEDEVIGVVHNGETKAYPVAILNWHEVVNDRFGDQAVAVTYCPLCATATVLVAESEGQSLAFGVSGLLYNSNVLLYDRQTESLWSQVLAEAVTGPMKGRVLRTLPLTLTSWQTWRRAHPHSLVLSADTGHLRDYGRDPYREYARRNQLMFPVREQSRILPLKEMVTGLILNGEPPRRLAGAPGAPARQPGRPGDPHYCRAGGTAALLCRRRRRAGGPAGLLVCLVRLLSTHASVATD